MLKALQQISIRGEASVYKTSSVRPHLTKMTLSGRDNEWSCTYVLEVSVLLLCTTLLLYFGIVPTMCYFVVFHLIVQVVFYYITRHYSVMKNCSPIWNQLHVCTSACCTYKSISMMILYEIDHIC
jgi:hypothetical protein